MVDLHTTLAGAMRPPQEVWAGLSERTQRLRIGHVEVETLDPPGIALTLALHAIHHGSRRGPPVQELERAVERLDYEVWERARALSERIGAQGAYSAGLRLIPAGEQLADRLGLPLDESIELYLRAHGAPPAATTLHRILNAPNSRAKAAMVARKLAPSPTFMRHRYPIARRRRLGLVAAYAMRAAILATQSWPALRAWRRGRAATARRRDPAEPVERQHRSTRGASGRRAAGDHGHPEQR